MSAGWQSNARQIISRVEKRMAFALLFFRMERLAGVMPMRSASSPAETSPRKERERGFGAGRRKTAEREAVPLPPSPGRSAPAPRAGWGTPSRAGVTVRQGSAKLSRAP